MDQDIKTGSVTVQMPNVSSFMINHGNVVADDLSKFICTNCDSASIASFSAGMQRSSHVYQGGAESPEMRSGTLVKGRVPAFRITPQTKSDSQPTYLKRQHEDLDDVLLQITSP
jgi:hypothetical protein